MKSFLMFLLIIFLACGVATLGVVFLDDSIGDFGASLGGIAIAYGLNKPIQTADVQALVDMMDATEE